MIVYSTVFLFSIIIGPLLDVLFLKNRKTSRLLACILCFSALFLVSVFKDNVVGIDTEQYLIAYNEIANAEFPVFSYKGFEPGFVFVASLISHLGMSFKWFQCFIYLLCYTCFGIFAYFFSKNISLFAASFLGIGLFFSGLSALRQFCAVALVCLALVALYKSKNSFIGLFLFTVIVLLSITFHKSAILAFAFAPLWKFRWTWPRVALMASLTVLVMLFGNQIYRFAISMFSVHTSYLPTEQGVGMLSVVYLLLALGCSFCLLSNELFDYLNKYLFSIKLFASLDSMPPRRNRYTLSRSDEIETATFIGPAFLAAAIQAFSSASTIVPRLTWFFLPAVCVLISNVPSVERVKKIRRPLAWLFILCFALFFIYTIYLDPSINIYPYEFNFAF